MNYTQKLVLSMLVPTVMVAGAGSAVVAGAIWLQAQVQVEAAATIASYLGVGATATAILTSICVATCLAFTFWIRKTALSTLGADPSLAQEVLRHMADGKLAVPNVAAAPGSLMDSLNRLVHTMHLALTEIRDATMAIDIASGEISAGSHDLSNRTELTASNLQVASENMRLLVERVQQSVAAAREANQFAQSASAVAAQGGEVVGKVVSTMEEINQSSKRIADIIGVIDGIAFQTNILALNAAVEAARAGEQGRGFAVVASEVRSLAGRSAEAAKEIKALIGTSVDRIESGTRLVHEAGSTMGQIVESVNQVGTIISSISETANEQSAGISEVGQAVSELDQMTQQNAALVEESAAAAQTLKGQAQHLAHAVSMFELKDTKSSRLELSMG
jgi:methyl-accepting chemotaxis protein